MTKPATRKPIAKQARREFLRRSAAAGAGATIAATLPATALAEEAAVDKVEAKEENYRVTRHISDYYKSLA